MEDVPQEDPARADGLRSTDETERYTFQLFPTADRAIHRFVRHNSDAVFPENTVDKPLPLLLDFWYGSVAMKTWGQSTMQVFQDITDNIYYPEHGDSRDKDGDEDSEEKQWSLEKNIKKKEREERRLRRNANKETREFSIAEAGDFILALRWMAAGKKWPTKEDQDKVQHQRSVDKVSEWQARQSELC